MLTAVAAGINCRLLATPQRQLAERETKPRLASQPRRGSWLKEKQSLVSQPRRGVSQPRRGSWLKEKQRNKNPAEKKETKNKTLQRRGGHIRHKISIDKRKILRQAQFSDGTSLTPSHIVNGALGRVVRDAVGDTRECNAVAPSSAHPAKN